MTKQSLAYLTIASISLIGALLVFGQAVTLAGLSQFPAWQPELASLQFRFWIYISVGVVALLVGGGTAVRWVRQQNALARADGSNSAPR
ncbi:hypothetical protein [Mesorhizobium sp. B2-7-1]|uniref:hypothetical protein n=1 Tax=Mesorhizobium sp. B2-7-1 TaxID=2589909 RepID=UPI00112C510F|nr:hypothetical protein [Mesorhizobium sp. B2-7-1]TPJ54975.1 hypothetical protein FJ471_25395 [Mesorhizobium sp. B2-7-1]